MALSISELEQEIAEEFDLFEDQMEKYEYLIDVGKKLAPLPVQYLTDDYLVKGCQSKVWLHAYHQDGRMYYEADSNTAITKGIIALLIRVLSGQKTQDILDCPLGFIDRINLRAHLSSQRSNGLSAMVQKMKAYAAAYHQ
ncbi:MAG: SufE family protein [Bacteroidetes bacterium]|nr:SufE family protein [Bacteroidota bacterium]MBK8659696.1 SufE family protein [Bacteroidota bacterium]